MSEELTAEELVEMRRVAEAATKGPWESFNWGDGDIQINGRTDQAGWQPVLFKATAHGTPEDAQFIAKFDPTTVRRMLDAIEYRDDVMASMAWSHHKELAAKDAEIARLLGLLKEWLEADQHMENGVCTKDWGEYETRVDAALEGRTS